MTDSPNARIVGFGRGGAVAGGLAEGAGFGAARGTRTARPAAGMRLVAAMSGSGTGETGGAGASFGASLAVAAAGTSGGVAKATDTRIAESPAASAQATAGADQRRQDRAGLGSVCGRRRRAPPSAPPRIGDSMKR